MVEKRTRKSKTEKKTNGEKFIIVKHHMLVTIEFLEDVIGTVALNPDLFKRWQASISEDIASSETDINDETTSVPLDPNAGRTGFWKDPEKGLFVYDYWVRGFIKSTLQILIHNLSIPKISSYKKLVDTQIFINPRKIYFGLMEPDGVIERSLRVQTAKGERVALASSDIIKSGRKIEFEIQYYNHPEVTFEKIITILSFGENVGLGQWRGSGGAGRFKLIKVVELPDEEVDPMEQYKSIITRNKIPLKKLIKDEEVEDKE